MQLMRIFALIIWLLVTLTLHSQNPSDFVDPRIGTEGLGRTFIGPSMPYGMIKPSPDAVSMPNSGWAPLPEPIKGFSQVHVSGTGGGQKYGNILIMPFDAPEASMPVTFSDKRLDESVALGYYSTTLASGITTEITCSDRSAIYNFTYPDNATAAIAVDAGSFLGMSPVRYQRENQDLVGSQIQILSDCEVAGYNRVRGGWNNGRAYTVYFYAVTSQPFDRFYTWSGDSCSTTLRYRTDHGQYTGAALIFGKGNHTVQLKIGISFVSELKARENLEKEIPDYDFNAVRSNLTAAWNDLLGRVTLAPSTPESLRRMFYTGLYHTMIMPVDRSGENPLWLSDQPYYDDYYAIWDTYRTSSPMITLLDPERQVDIVNSLLNIYYHDGYMPDARSGNANGRTQGGSNAEIMIADAFVKGLDGIDYRLALEAMLKDADVPPGGNEEAEGRGGLREYNSLGYVPFGIPRAGNRTVEYSFCDFAIAQVAHGLGNDSIYNRFMRQSGNWRNLWRDDYEHAGTRGFIMPRDAEGQWLDSIPQGHSLKYRPKYEYTPMTFEGPWYTKWWDMFFYEAPSWEYSLSVPHDVPGLIDKCGGALKFEQRLDTFFDRGFYNVNNEPSFLSPMLYHWIGKPWRSVDRIREIVADNFNDSPSGLPGNDDSGAMSSWLAFHIMGLYPNAGHDYYLITSPMVDSLTIDNGNGHPFTIVAKDLDDTHRYVGRALLNGQNHPYSTISHSQLVGGGTLTLEMTDIPDLWHAMPLTEAVATVQPDNRSQYRVAPVSVNADIEPTDLMFVMRLHGQTRRYRVTFTPDIDGGIVVSWGIERNLKWQQGTFTVSRHALEDGNILDFSMPADGSHVTLPSSTTVFMLSRSALRSLKTHGSAVYNNAEFHLDPDCRGDEYEGVVIARSEEGTVITVLDNPDLPIILGIHDNPLEVDWQVRLP